MWIYSGKNENAFHVPESADQWTDDYEVWGECPETWSPDWHRQGTHSE